MTKISKEEIKRRLDAGVSLHDAKTRGTGRTTDQMLKLKNGGLFIVDSQTSQIYCSRLALKLNRGDIKFATLGNLGFMICGRKYPDIDMDHYARELCNQETRDLFNMARKLYIKKKF